MRRLRPASRLFCLLLLSILLLPGLAAEGAGTNGLDLGTVALSLPTLAKSLTPLALALGSGGDREALLFSGAAALAWTLPGAMLLANAWSGNAAGTRLWRRVSLVADGVAFAALLGAGLWMLNSPPEPGSWNDLAGAVTIMISLPAGAAFGLDWIPWPAETR